VSTGKDSLVERVQGSGVRSASPVDLIAIALSRRAEDASPAEAGARDIYHELGGIVKVADISGAELREQGLDEYEALRVLAIIELGRRAGRAEKGLHPEIDVPEDVYEVLEHLKHEKREHFVILMLDAKNQMIRRETVHIGTLNMSIVGPREVFRIAIREGASSIIVAHNHPSGDPTPSPEDLEVTRRLVEVGKLIDIPVVDHVIIGDPGSVSFVRRGLL